MHSPNLNPEHPTPQAEHTPELSQDTLRDPIPDPRNCNKWHLVTRDGFRVGVIDHLIGESFARRIVERFNAGENHLSGIADPSAVLKEAREAREALQEISKMSSVHSWAAPRLALAALAKLGGKA